MNINTVLLLRIADELEAHPERYDQQIGINPGGELDGTCATCVAGNALRLEGCDLDDFEEWDQMWSDAAASLGLSDVQATVLFRANPRREWLAGEFPRLTREALEAIPELRRWTIDDEGRSAVRTGANPRRLSFDEFWRRVTADKHA